MDLSPRHLLLICTGLFVVVGCGSTGPRKLDVLGGDQPTHLLISDQDEGRDEGRFEGQDERPESRPKTHSVSIQWDPPTTRADGSPLTKVEGYSVTVQGEDGEPREHFVQGQKTSLTLDLAPGDYLVTVQAVGAGFHRSEPSAELRLTVPTPASGSR